MDIKERASLPRRLGLFSTIAVVIGSTIGSGIFRSPASIATLLPSGAAMLGVWLAGGVLALCGALTLAEVGGALPYTGGIYVFIREGWGQLPAFLFGWAELVIIRAAALGAVATTLAEYLLRVRGFDPAIPPYDAYVHYVAAVAITVFAIVNIVGVRWSALVIDLSSIAKYGGLALIVLAVFALGGHAAHGVAPAAATTTTGHVSGAAFGLALVAVLWAYDGWADLCFVAGEVTEPRRNVPRALITGTAAVIAIYLAANIAYLRVLDVHELASSKLVAADVAQRVVGPWGVTFVAITVVFATIGTLNSSLLTAPRIFFSMADDGVLFRAIAAVHPRFETPYVAIALNAALGIAFVLLRTFEQLADTFVTAIVPFYALAVAAVFVLRRRPDYDPPYRVPGYPLVPALFILATILILGNALIAPASRWPTAAVFAGVLAGIPVYYTTVGRRRNTGA